MRDIVLVHSNEKLSDVYSRRLQEQFQVHKAFDGISGLRLIKRSNPHLVIAEHELPWLSGIGLLRYIRSHPTLSATPFLILSRELPDSDALKFGANEWIRPQEVTVDQLMDKVLYHLINNKVLKN